MTAVEMLEFAAFSLVVLLILSIRWNRLAFALGLPVHNWRYHNPHCRRCETCRRGEMNASNKGWEEQYPGDTGHGCSTKTAYTLKDSV